MSLCLKSFHIIVFETCALSGNPKVPKIRVVGGPPASKIVLKSDDMVLKNVKKCQVA